MRDSLTLMDTDTNPDKGRDTGDASDPLTRADILELIKAVTEAMIAQAQRKSTEVEDPGEGTSAGASKCSGTEWRAPGSMLASLALMARFSNLLMAPIY